VRKESAKKVADQQAELEKLGTRDMPSDALAEIDRTKLEYQLVTGMESIADEIDPLGLLDKNCEVLSEESACIATPYYFYTRMHPRIAFAAFQFVAKQFDADCDITINYDSVQMLIDTKITLPKSSMETGLSTTSDHDESTTKDEELPSAAILPSTLAIAQYKVGSDEDVMYVILCKRVNGDPLTFKRVVDVMLDEPNIQKLRHIRAEVDLGDDSMDSKDVKEVAA
jgi:hypothetical protein